MVFTYTFNTAHYGDLARIHAKSLYFGVTLTAKPKDNAMVSVSWFKDTAARIITFDTNGEIEKDSISQPMIDLFKGMVSKTDQAKIASNPRGVISKALEGKTNPLSIIPMPINFGARLAIMQLIRRWVETSV